MSAAAAVLTHLPYPDGSDEQDRIGDLASLLPADDNAREVGDDIQALAAAAQVLRGRCQASRDQD